MMRSGVADLPLHPGKAPRWLFKRMVALSDGIVDVMCEEFGTCLVIERVSDPYWFQALSCVLGFDWHSSGTTTVTCGALKEAINTKERGIRVAGGKGRTSKRTPTEILSMGDDLGLKDRTMEGLVYSSRMSAKVDNTAIQDGHQLYHHVMLFTENGNWTVVQQGLSDDTGYARRYHWSSHELEGFIEDNNQTIMGASVDTALDMTADVSQPVRDVSVDLVNDGVQHLRREVQCPDQRSLDEWNGGRVKTLSMPRTINWAALKKAYDVQPQDYEEFISLPGIGPSTVRALAMVSELIYGDKASWKDPVKYSFTVGGKDGVPYPVDRSVMDRTVEVIRAGVDEASIGKREKLEALQRLRRFVPPDAVF